MGEVGIHKTDQEANLHLLQWVTSDVEINNKIFQYAPDLTLTMTEGRAPITYRELETSRR